MGNSSWSFRKYIKLALGLCLIVKDNFIGLPLILLVGAADRSVRSLDHPRRAPSDRQTTWFKFARKVQTRCATRPRASRLVRGRPA